MNKTIFVFVRGDSCQHIYLATQVVSDRNPLHRMDLALTSFLNAIAHHIFGAIDRKRLSSPRL